MFDLPLILAGDKKIMDEKRTGKKIMRCGQKCGEVTSNPNWKFIKSCRNPIKSIRLSDLASCAMLRFTTIQNWI